MREVAFGAEERLVSHPVEGGASVSPTPLEVRGEAAGKRRRIFIRLFWEKLLVFKSRGRGGGRLALQNATSQDKK